MKLINTNSHESKAEFPRIIDKRNSCAFVKNSCKFVLLIFLCLILSPLSYLQPEEPAPVKLNKQAELKKKSEKEEQKKLGIEVISKQRQAKLRRLAEERASRAKEKENILKQLTAQEARKKEQKKIEAGVIAYKKQQELVLKQGQRKATEEEKAKLKAEQERQSQIKEYRLQAEKQRLAFEKEVKSKRLNEEKGKQQLEQAFQEKFRQEQLKSIKRAHKSRLGKAAYEEELKQESLRQKEKEARVALIPPEKERIAGLKMLLEKLRAHHEEKTKLKIEEERQAQLKAQKEENARMEAERQRELAKLKARKEKELQAKREEENRLARLIHAQKQEEARIEAERQAEVAEARTQREEIIQAQKEEEQKLAQIKAENERLMQVQRQEKERIIQAQKQEKARLEAQAQHQSELAKKEADLRRLAQLKAEAQRRIQAHKKEMPRKQVQTQRKEEDPRMLAQLKMEEARAKEQQQELARQGGELKEKLRASIKSVSQEKAVAEAMLSKHREDQAKIDKIEKLWAQARKLYSQGMYEEAVKDFQKIIELEGNPRIKYTPAAKEYIEKAKEKLVEKKQEVLSKEVELLERDMMSEVIRQQKPPYIEPPIVREEVKEAPLIEPPVIRKKLKKNVTLDFDKVGLESVLAFLSQDTGVNFVASKMVQDAGLNVSVRFQQTPVEEVIKYISKSLGLIYRIDKEIIWIAHPEEVATEIAETRVYYLSKGGGLFTEFSAMGSGSTETGLGGSSAQVSKITTIEDTLKEIVPWPSDSKLFYDKRINALIIRNTPQNLQMLEDLLYNLDVTPYQILIEARFLEVDITDTKEFGLEWKFGGGDFPLQQKRGTDFHRGIGKDSGVDFSSFTRGTEGMNLTYKALLTGAQFETVIHALEETKKLKTLSSPRITTLNNQMATIKVVDEWIYPSRYEYEVVQTDVNGDGDFNDAGETTYKNVPKDFLRRDVGILLKVIPSVGADRKTINLSLIPEVSEATADGFTYTGDVKLPKFTSRNLSTTVVANSGDTVVLGGMIKESRTKTTTKVPFLGDIPFLGAFFKKDADSIQRKNLLIFVTAKILSPSGEEVVVAQK